MAITLHWAAALLLIVTLSIGWWAEHGAGGRSQRLLYEAHFSLGLLTLLAMTVRIAWRLYDARPNLPNDLARPQRVAAAVVHALLYFFTLAALMSGLVNFLFLGPIRVFGFVEVPRLFDPITQEPLRALSWYAHIYAYLGLLLLVAAHVAASLHHHFIRRDELLTQMWYPAPPPSSVEPLSVSRDEPLV